MMTIDHAIDVLSSAIKQLADGGFVCSGELAFIQPHAPTLIASEATFERAPIPRLILRTVRRTPVPVMPAAMPLPAMEPDRPSAVSGDVCFKCGGGRMQRTGTCHTCLDCGESGGCG